MIRLLCAHEITKHVCKISCLNSKRLLRKLQKILGGYFFAAPCIRLQLSVAMLLASTSMMRWWCHLSNFSPNAHQFVGATWVRIVRSPICFRLLYIWWTNLCCHINIWHTCNIIISKFYKSFNAIFGKVGRVASESVIMQLISSKCLPVLLYAIEACPFLARDQSSVSFAVTRVLMKIFRTRSRDVTDQC